MNGKALPGKPLNKADFKYETLKDDPQKLKDAENFIRLRITRGKPNVTFRSTGHTLIQPNPVLRDDELGLKRDYGLEYIAPDPIAHVVFPDGESFTHWLDLDRTCDEIARFSRRDADAYRRVLAEFAEIREPLGRYRFNPIGYAPPLEQALADKPRWLRRLVVGSYDVIRREYESRHVQSYMLWQAFQTAQPVDSPGSGLLAYSIVAGRQAQSWTLPLGGSGELPRALVRFLEDHGARL